MEAVQEQCLQRLERDVTIWKIGTGGQRLPPAAILGQLCPKDCSGQGQCEGGEKVYVCVCMCAHACVCEHCLLFQVCVAGVRACVRACV